MVAAVLLYLRSRRRKRQHAGATKADARSSGSFLDGAAAADLSTVGGLQSPGRGSQQDVSGRGLQQAQASGTVGGVRGSFGRDGLQLGELGKRRRCHATAQHHMSAVMMQGQRIS